MLTFDPPGAAQWHLLILYYCHLSLQYQFSPTIKPIYCRVSGLQSSGLLIPSVMLFPDTALALPCVSGAASRSGRPWDLSVTESGGVQTTYTQRLFNTRHLLCVT